MNVRFNFAAVALGVSALVLASSHIARAQQYPSQDIHLISGFAAGSGADVIVRFIAEKLRPLAGKNVIVENKPGAGGMIATEYVARSKPDGYTVYITGASGLAANMHIQKNPSVDVGKALQVVGTLNKQPMMIAVRGDSPYTTLAQLTEAMKAKGSKASYAFANPISRVVGAMYKEKAGILAEEVSYRTGAEYLNDLASGAIDFAIPDNVLAIAQSRQGRMRILAVSTGERMQSAAQIPTMKESGYDTDLLAWWGGLVPAATPRPIVDQLNAWLSEIVRSDEGKKFFANFASDTWATTPDEAQRFFLGQIKDWGDYVRIAKIEPQG